MIKTIKEIRKEYYDYLIDIHPNWNKPRTKTDTASQRVTDTFYLWNNGDKKAFWEYLSGNKDLEEAYRVIESLLRKKCKSVTDSRIKAYCGYFDDFKYFFETRIGRIERIIDGKKIEVITVQEDLISRFSYFAQRHNARLLVNDVVDTLKNEGCVYYSHDFFKVLEDSSKDKKLAQSLNRGKTLYRARIIKPENYSKKCGLDVKKINADFKTYGYNECNSIEPPLGHSGAGRNNIYGVSYLYVADDIETVCAEVKPTPREVISVAEFEIKSKLKIFDLSNDKTFHYQKYEKCDISLATFFSELMFNYTVPIANEEDYFFCQVVTDYIRKMGFDGISYRSFYTGKTNYTIFNCHKSKIEFKRSKIVLCRSNDLIFWDFDEKKAFHTCRDKDTEFDNDVAEKMLNNLKKTIEP